MVFSDPLFWVAPPAIDVAVFAVIAVLLYLIVRFAVRDGLRSHTRWLEQRTPRSLSGEGGSTFGEDG